MSAVGSISGYGQGFHWFISRREWGNPVSWPSFSSQWLLATARAVCGEELDVECGVRTEAVVMAEVAIMTFSFLRGLGCGLGVNDDVGVVPSTSGSEEVSPPELYI